MEFKELNIYEKMLAIQTELQTVAKNLQVSTGKGSYKAVSERDIIDAVKPLEAFYRIYSYPVEREIVSEDILEQDTQYGKRLSFFMRVKTVYRFVNIDNKEEYIETTTYADGIDTGDKATGKAMTYGDKYALMKAYKISTGDDPDAKASEVYNSIPSKTPVTAEAIFKIKSLYSNDEIQGMLERLKLKEITQLKMSQANKMIMARTGLNDQTPTY